MSQPRLICQGTLKYWIQQEWYRLTAVILASNENFSLTLTKLSLQSWLSSPSQGVILDMSLSSVLALESASVGSKDGVYLILLFTKRSTHVLSAMSEQDRIQWQGRFEQIIGEEWKFRVTIPCQQDLKQECQGVLRFNTKRRTIVVTHTQDNRGLPVVLYHWTLKSIKSFGANDDMLVLDTSSSTEAGRCYFCFNTTQADQILTVFREATGILPQSCHVYGGRNSARFADINRVKKAIERNSQSQLAKRGVSSEINKLDEDEIHYEVADDEDTLNRRSTPGQHSSDPTRNEGNLGVNSPPNLIPDRSAEIESRHQLSNPARLYHFPSPEADDRDLHSHMHAVPVMEDRMALAIKQRSSPLPPNLAKNPRAVTPQNEFPEARKVKKYQDKPPTNEPRKKRSRSRNAFRILSGRSTPRGTEDTSQCAPSSRASSRPTSPTPSFIHRAMSKLKGPFHRSRENILSEEEEAASRVRSESRQKINSETKSQFSHMKRNYAAVPAASQSTQNNLATQPILQLDRPIPPRNQHIPKHPPQPIIVQHPQPIQPLHTPTSPHVPQPGHFVPSQHPNTMAYMNNQVLTPPNYMMASNTYPMQQLCPNQLIVNPHQAYNQQMMWEHNVPILATQHITTTPIQYNEPNPYNRLSAKKPVQTQTTQTNKQITHTNTSELNKNASTQIVSPAPHRIIDSSSPLPLNPNNTPVVSQPSTFRVTPGNNQPRISSSQHIPALLPSSPVTPPAVTACQDDDISQTDSGNYDHLSPSQLAKNFNSAVFSGLPDILQTTNKSADTAIQSAELQSSPTIQRRAPPGGQLTPLALIFTEQNQQALKPSSEYRGIRRQDAFRLSGPTSQQKNKPPVISPKPTLLSPNKETVSTEDVAGGEVSKSSLLLQPQLPATSPSYLLDPDLSTEC